MAPASARPTDVVRNFGRGTLLAGPSGAGRRPAARRQGAGTVIQPAAALIRRLAQARFLRFLVVGGLNTVFGYGLFYLLLRLSGSALFALTLGTVIGVLFNFVTTGALVFRTMERRRLAKFLGVYGIVYLYNAAGLTILQAMALDPALAGLLLLPGAVAISYGLNRSFVFNRAPAVEGGPHP
ncbi:GtrA family protein [Rhodoblastus acidophilus]|nr:GtrA family protein [Rhodoblastus acidophilus]RAI22483.1 GtrA family protein [Rhodoblastus acidophilus]